MTSLGIASVKQLRLPLAPPEDEARSRLRREDAPVCLPNLLERALERSNMFDALRRVRRNQGAPGVDGMTVDELPGYLGQEKGAHNPATTRTPEAPSTVRAYGRL